ncbi:hypothetical protein ABPG74_006425 [Tetrahymena malaccensis]
MMPQSQNQDLVQYFENIIKNHQEFSYFINNPNEYKKITKIATTQFSNYLFEQFEQKNVIYIRHAESPINVWVSKNPIKFMLSMYPPDPQLYNPGITEKGMDQCVQLEKLLNKAKKYELIEQKSDEQQQQQQFEVENMNLPSSFSLVVLSPYQRTIKTFDQIRQSEVFKTAKIITSSLIRERANIPASVVGYMTSQLKQNRNDIDYQYLNKEKWWKLYDQQDENFQNHQTESIKRESNIELQFRVLIFLIWITLREEKDIIFFSHCAVYEAIKLFKVKKPNNAQPYRITKQDFFNLYRQFFKTNPSL